MIIDCGFSLIKVLVISDNKVIKSFIADYNEDLLAIYQKCNTTDVIIFGVNCEKVRNRLKTYVDCVYELSEIDSIGFLSEHYSCNNTLVVSFGSGITFVEYNKGEVKFVTGVGYGACALKELYRIIFPQYSFKEVLGLSSQGIIANTNTEVGKRNIIPSDWLFEKTTLIGFSHHSEIPSDIALGILRMFMDGINSIVRTALNYKEIDKIILTGTTFVNKKAKEILDYDFQDADHVICATPEYGACIGAYYVYLRRILHDNKSELKIRN